MKIKKEKKIDGKSNLIKIQNYSNKNQLSSTSTKFN